MKKTPLIEIKDLSIRREAPILKSIDWTLRAGEHWVILGANGSGKTSLLSALTGYLMPSAGTIRVLGRDYGAYDWRELRKEIGLVSSSIRQRIEEAETALETVLSGKTAMLNFRGRSTTADRRQALRLLRQVDCGKLAVRPWGHLSQGERQRVLIGRALMGERKILILDEPCAGLDPVAREQFLRFIGCLAKRAGGPALVLVTHHVEEILPVFSHVLLLKNGKVLAAGPVGKTLTSQAVSKTFGASLHLRCVGRRYELKWKPEKRSRKILGSV